MATTIEIPFNCEIQSVIRFLQAEGYSAAEIHQRLCNVYGDNVLSDGSIREWCQKFKEGRVDVHVEGGQGRKSMATDDVVERVDRMVQERCRFTITELSADFPKILGLLFMIFLLISLGIGNYVLGGFPNNHRCPQDSKFGKSLITHIIVQTWLHVTTICSLT